MKADRRIGIRRYAEKVRGVLSLGVPADVMDAVRKLNGTVVRFDPSELDHEAYVKPIPQNAGGPAFQIGISAGVGEARLRFSIAHELGHLFLHMNFPSEGWQAEQYQDAVKYRYGYSKEEAEAHEFAGSLLMPEAEFRAKVTELQRDGEVSISSLASAFDVSPEAARVRGCYLGLWDWNT